jgi:hypothetical protein
MLSFYAACGSLSLSACKSCKYITGCQHTFRISLKDLPIMLGGYFSTQKWTVWLMRQKCIFKRAAEVFGKWFLYTVYCIHMYLMKYLILKYIWKYLKGRVTIYSTFWFFHPLSLTEPPIFYSFLIGRLLWIRKYKSLTLIIQNIAVMDFLLMFQNFNTDLFHRPWVVDFNHGWYLAWLFLE